MKKREVAGQSACIFDEQGTQQVNEQIMDAYSSGVIDQPESQYAGEYQEGSEGRI